MANIIENVIIARDEATPKLRAVRAELGQFSSSLKTVRGQLSSVAQSVGTISPAVSAAMAPVANLASGLSAIGGATGVMVGVSAGIAAIGVAAIKTAADLANTVEQLDLMAARTGVGIEPLQVLRRIIEESGGSADSLTMALGFLNRAIATQDPLLAKLGIQTKDTFAAFQQLIGILAASDETAKKTEIAYQLLGRGSGDLLGMTVQLTEAFKSTEDRMRSTGALIDEKMAPAARKLDEQMDQLSLNWKGFMTRIQEATTPVALEIVDAFNRIWDAASGRGASPAEVENRKLKQLEEDLATTQATLKAVQESPDPIGTILGKHNELLERDIKELESKIARLKLQIGILRGTRREFGEDDLPLNEPAGLATPKPLPEIKAPAGETEREKMLTRLQELLRLTRSEAELAYADLKRLDDSAAALALQEKLSKARGVPVEAIRKAAEMPWEPSTVQRRGLEAGDLDAQARAGLSEAMAKRAESRRGVPDFSDVARAFKTTLDEMNAYSQVTTDLIYGSFYALQGALTSVFQGIYGNLVGIPGQVMTMSKAIVSIVNSMVNEILAGLARLAASRLFLLLINLLGLGLPTKALKEAANVPWETISRRGLSAGGLIRGPGSETSDSVPVRLSRGEFVVRASAVRQPGVLQHLEAINRGSVRSGFSAPRVDSAGQGMTFNERSGRARSGGNTFVIQALSARDAILSLTQPGGELRRAMDDVVMQGAY